MTLKRTIELLKEYLGMNNIIELTDVNKYRLDDIQHYKNHLKQLHALIKFLIII